MLIAYCKGQGKLLALLTVFGVIFAGVFSLYDLPAEAVGYAVTLCLAAGLVLFAVGFGRYVSRRRTLGRILAQVEDAVIPLPPAGDAVEEDYQSLVCALCTHRANVTMENENRLRDMTDYYTLWAHQIKTPIAAMHLLLQEDAGSRSAELAVELLKVEQYVEMVLSYLRLGSESTDYVLRTIALDELLRQAVRKFAKLFILKKIELEFQETGKTALSDDKWLLFVVEQVLSNALKYTPEGGKIRIYAEGETLVISDSGIGIREEDLPRIFEKGFTGYNGRADKKSTGIGLYLCHQVMARLGHGIRIYARPGEGTLVRLDLSRRQDAFVE